MKSYACHNAPRKDRYQVHVRQYEADGSWLLKRQWIKDVMSLGCKYDVRATDPRCAGCLK